MARRTAGAFSVCAAALLLGAALSYESPAQAPSDGLGPYAGAVLSWKEDITLAAPFERQIALLHVDEGDIVKKDEVLVELDDAEAALAVAEREAAVARAEAEVALQQALLDESYAQLDAARYLRNKNAISEEEFRQAEVRVKVQRQRVIAAEKDLAAARVSLDQAKLILSRHKIKSPVDGTVLRVFYRQGAFVDRGSEHGLRLCRLVRTDVLRAIVRVPLRDAVRISRGAAAVFQIDMPQLQDTPLSARTFKGRVTFLGDIDPVDGTQEVWADIQNEDNLLQANMLGTLRIFGSGAAPRTVAK